MYRIEYLFKDGTSCIDEVETLTEVADTLDISNFDSKHDGLIITVRNEGQPIWRYQIEVATRIEEVDFIRRKRVEVKQ
jgi:hypothetical protein